MDSGCSTADGYRQEAMISAGPSEGAARIFDDRILVPSDLKESGGGDLSSDRLLMGGNASLTVTGAF